MKLGDKQKVFLLELCFTGIEPLKSKLKPAHRKPLIDAKLIEIEKRGPRREHIVLSEAGWKWVSENLAIELSTVVSTKKAFTALLAKTSRFLKLHDVALTEFLNPNPAQLIRRAYLERTGGNTKKRVRLSELRAALPEVQRSTFDSALFELHKTGRAALFPFDNPRELTTEDERSAFDLSGVKQHVVYLEE